MRFSTIFFDLDDTLYPNSTGLWHAIKERMNLYMSERMGILENEVPVLREQYFKMYGTTLRGLIERHNVDEQDFLAFVHDLPLKDYLEKIEISLIRRALHDTEGVIAHAAEKLQVRRTTLAEKMKRYGI